MKKEKRGSSYRIRKKRNGKTYSITFDHRPTNDEIEAALAKKMGNPLSDLDLNFTEAAAQYVELKKNVLSEASIREYTRTAARLPEWFQDVKLSSVDSVVIQRLVNEMSKDLSAKTVHDRYAFVCAVLRLFNPTMVNTATLPKKRVVEPYIPTHEDVKRILDESIGTQYHIALQLACLGLRRSEITALELSDLIEDDETGSYFLNVNKALVQDENNNWIIKTTKTASSTRIIPIDKDLAEEILTEVKDGRIFKGYPETIATYLHRTQAKLGIEHFSLHKLRHYFASTLITDVGLDLVSVQKLGGWEKGSQVPIKIYAHTQIQKDKQKLIEVSNALKSARS